MRGTGPIFERAIAEPEFRRQLFAGFDQAVAGYDLTADERAALRAITPAGFEQAIGAALAHRFVAARVTPRIVVIPAWQDDPPHSPDDIAIRLLPHTAFGNGRHATTRMVLAALEEFLRPGDRLLDLGTGSGIVSIAAAKFGASVALGLDISARAAETARQNIRLNGVEDTACAGRGSLPDALKEPPFDLVIANILTPVIVEMLKGGIAHTVRPGGRIILSGITGAGLPQVLHVLAQSGLALEAHYRARSSWVALVCRPAPA